MSYEPGGKAASTTVALRNAGEDEIGDLSFSARVRDSEGNVRDDEVNVVPAESQPKSIDGLAVQWVRLQIGTGGEGASRTYTGYLVVEGDGEVAPATRPLRLAPVRLPPLDAGWLVYSTLLVAAVLIVARALTLLRSAGFGLGNRMGPADWDFGKSWASTLTTVGALLGTVLSAGVLPADTQSLSKPAYAALNLFFGVLILIAGFVYAATRRPKDTNTSTGGTQVQYQGYVWSFLLAGAVTLWAVLGELATLWFLLTEIGIQGTLAVGPLRIFQGVLLLAGLLVLVYAWRTISWTLEQQTDRETQRAELQAQMARSGARLAPAPGDPAPGDLEPQLPSWPLL